jgi:two-component system OmpR family sensor kinase
VSRLPLRRGLALASLGLTALALLLAGVVSVVSLQSYLVERTDRQLRAAATLARERVALADTADGRGAALRAVIAPSDYVVEFRTAAGQTVRLAGPDDLAPGALLADAPTPPAGGGISSAVTIDGYRAVTVRSGGATVVVALSLDPVRDTVRRLATVEVVAGGVVLVVLGLFARLLLARGLRPLDEITATAGAIAAGDLGRRVPADMPPDTEVGRLTAAVNGMLGRIQAALADAAHSQERVRVFVADASHELRTPLTSIRGYLQLLRKGMVPHDARPDVLRRADEEATRMATIVDDLLYLARLDAEPALRMEPVDLVPVVRDALADALAVQPGRPARLETPPRCVVTGDEAALRQVVTNLLANVRAHTPPDAAVRVTLTPGPHVTLTVADRGPGVRLDLARRVFDRFVRAESSTGSGLGLAIVAEIVRTHGGDVQVGSGPAGGTTVTVVLPAGPSSDVTGG